MAAPCVLTNTFAELNGQKAAIVPVEFHKINRTAPASQPDDSFYMLYDSVTGAVTFVCRIGTTAVTIDMATAPTGL